MTQLNISERPIVIYDCNKQQAIGIFRTQRIIGRYLNPGLYMNRKGNGIANALNRKSRLEKSERFDFPVALRYITKEQEGLLPDGVDYIIFKDYLKPLPVQM